MEATRVGKRAQLSSPPKLRKRYGIGESTFILRNTSYVTLG